MEAYVKGAAGHFEKRFTESGQEYEVWIVDLPTTRHAIDKFVPAAKQEIGVEVGFRSRKAEDQELVSNVEWHKPKPGKGFTKD